VTDINHQIWMKSALGKDLTEAEARELHLTSRRETYGDGECIFEEGSAAEEFFLIVQGEVDVLKRLDGSRTAVIATLGPGSCLGEMSLLSHERRSASARVKGDTIVLRVEWPQFRELQEHNPAVAYKLVYAMARVLAGRLKRINLKVAELSTIEGAESDNKKLEEFASFKQKLLSDWSF
jgi:CRP/FNR family transcriptional regulator, cyclic AMP receptor protein